MIERRPPSFDELAAFVREWAGIPNRKRIAPETLFEDDLGITGDDGCELLDETERRFDVCCQRQRTATEKHSTWVQMNSCFIVKDLVRVGWTLLAFLIRAVLPMRSEGLRLANCSMQCRKHPQRAHAIPYDHPYWVLTTESAPRNPVLPKAGYERSRWVRVPPRTETTEVQVVLRKTSSMKK
jgi:hypothetical protein